MNIDSETTVGKLAAEHPLATRVLARHGIDFCCGGGRPLREVCSKKGLDSAQVLAEIHRELQTTNASEENWNEAPLDDLIDHILDAYHEPLREELPRLGAMARKVFDVHGARDPERFSQLVDVYTGLEAELQAHMDKEEQVLFPMIRREMGQAAQMPISMMEHEHDNAGAALHRLHELTDGYKVPDGACNTWRALWHGLAALEESLHQHIHLENNILFPRALAA